MTEAFFNTEAPVDSMGPDHSIFPPELWSKVFTFAVKDEPHSRNAILRVNRAFRFIANRTPQLWTQISAINKEDFLDPCGMGAGLEKSGALPLHVYISSESETVNVDIRPLAKYLRKHISRFQTLHLNLESARVTAVFLSVMAQDCPAPLLQQLTLDIFEIEEEVDIESITLGSIFHPSPRLEHLSIHPNLLPAFTNSTLLPTVKDFTIAVENCYIDVGPDTVFALLSQMPLMECFTFEAPDIQAPDIQSNSLLPTLFVMPHLLSVDVTVPGTGLKVLSGIKSLLLQRVRLDGYCCYSNVYFEWDNHLGQLLESALRHLSQHSPKISHLEFLGIGFNNQEVTYPWIMGSGFPSLEALKISYCNITDDVLQLCKPLKMMKRLELECCDHLTRDGLLHVIEGRSADFELNICLCRNITQDDVAVLSDVVKVEYIEYIDYKQELFRDLTKFD